MSHRVSRRLRMRFFEEDERAIAIALSLTAHSSKSNVIRGALAFYEAVWTSLHEGFRVVYSRDGEPECPDVMADAAAAAATGEGPRKRTETSIELRITPADHERITGLISREAADTSSETVRRAVRVYAAAAERRRDGWEVVAVSPSGDVLQVPVPGMGVAPRSTQTPRLRPVATPMAAIQPRALGDLLPRSLSGMVSELAEKEKCPSDLLLIDIIRTETLARLHGFRPDMSATVQHAPAEAQQLPEPAQTQSAADQERGEQVVREISCEFDDIDEQVDNLMRMFGEAAQSDGQQELSDLLFAAGLVDDGSAAAGVEDTAEAFAPGNSDSPLTRLAGLLSRAKHLNERLEALASIAAIAPRKRKKRTPKPDETPAEKPAI